MRSCDRPLKRPVSDASPPRAPLKWQYLGWLPAPAVVVPANYALAIIGHPRLSMVALTTHFARLVAVALFSLRVAA